MNDCKLCNGDRVLPIPQEKWPPGVFQPVESCPCTQKLDKEEYLNRVWSRLAATKPVKKSPLSKKVDSDLRIRASQADLRAHVARIARDTEGLLIRVCTDTDLITAWLYSASDIQDPEAAETRDSEDDEVYPRLSTLINPPDLLILILGMKLAPNKATPSVVMETLAAREFLGKPTWVAERAGVPLSARHPCFSDELMMTLAPWPMIELTRPADDAPEQAPKFVTLPQPILEAHQDLPPGELPGGMKIFGGKKKKSKHFG